MAYNAIISKTLPVSSETTQHSIRFSNPLQTTYCVFYQVNPKTTVQGKMQISFIIVFLFSLHKVYTIDIMPELKKNVSNFRYGANFKYEGMLMHPFDRFYVVTKYEIPKVEQLQFTTFTFDLTCNHLNIS